MRIFEAIMKGIKKSPLQEFVGKVKQQKQAVLTKGVGGELTLG